jgi:hypothetical protein
MPRWALACIAHSLRVLRSSFDRRQTHRAFKRCCQIVEYLRRCKGQVPVDKLASLADEVNGLFDARPLRQADAKWNRCVEAVQCVISLLRGDCDAPTAAKDAAWLAFDAISLHVAESYPARIKPRGSPSARETLDFYERFFEDMYLANDVFRSALAFQRSALRRAAS